MHGGNPQNPQNPLVICCRPRIQNYFLQMNTGIAIAFLPSLYARVAPRSGLALKCIDVGAGVIAGDFRGPVKTVLINQSDTHLQINRGDRIAQLVFERIETPLVTKTNTLPDTERGTKGFGSTGISGTPKVGNVHVGSKDRKSTRLNSSHVD